MDRIPSRYHFPSPGFDHYWKHGHGKRLAAPFPDAFASEEEIRRLTPLLLSVDEAADRVVREVLLVHGFPKTHAWIAAGLSGDVPEDMPLPLRDMIAFTLQQPDWLDLDRLETGARLCRRSGAKGLIVLRNYCLMGGYESSAINKPLIFTEALKKGPGKRITETTEFWVTVVGETAMQRTEGLKACLVVRLMHAYSRVAILQRSDWQTDDWGMPLNHWDMIATNLGFSVVFLNGLRLLGMQPSAEEVGGLFHFWKYIGYLLGIPADQLPEDEAAAVRALYCWTITQPPADEDTKALARALMMEPLNDKFPVKPWQKRRVLQVHLGYNYYFLGAKSCAAMGLPAKGWTIYPFLLRSLTRVRELLNRISPGMMRNSVRTAGRRQEKIVDAFLKGYEKR
jgi:hypothetical protein